MALPKYGVSYYHKRTKKKRKGRHAKRPNKGRRSQKKTRGQGK